MRINWIEKRSICNEITWIEFHFSYHLVRLNLLTDKMGYKPLDYKQLNQPINNGYIWDSE